MKAKIAFSKKDLAVILVGTILVLLNTGAIGSNGQERSKRMVCLINLNKLTHAWILYANDNDGRIVNGAIGYSNMQMSWGNHANELAWVDVFSTDWDIARHGIRKGALWPYLRIFNIYRCTAGRHGQALTYSIMSSMNAVNHTSTQGEPGVHVKNLTEIQNPEQRLVFIDAGRMIRDAFNVYYDQERWWDDPPIHHSDGTTVSFADGHSEHWNWKGTDTIQHARDVKNTGPQIGWVPRTYAGFQDLYRMQRGCWGKLGYTPSH